MNNLERSRHRRPVLSTLILLLSIVTMSAQTTTLHPVASNDCGVDGKQPFLVKGDNYTMPDETGGSMTARTCNFGGSVIYAFDRLDIQADYQLEVVYLADSERRQRIVADGNEVQAPVVLEKGKEQRYRIDLPKKAFAYGQLVLVFEVLKGPNAIVSELNLYSSNPKKPIPFEGDKKLALAQTQSYRVDTTVNVEEHLPVYTTVPYSVPGVYNPVLSLNGTWQFNPSPKADFYTRKADTDGWSPIVVPGQWSMQGFKVDSAGFGGYQTLFTLPADWKGKQVKLRFDGVSSECIVWLNGKEIGTHMGGMTAFELDATTALQPGENRLALKVRSESLADMLGSLTQYAAHQLGGITRKVTLFAVPDVHLSDLRIVTELDEQYKDAELKVYLAVTNAGKETEKNIAARLSIGGLPVVLDQVIPELSPGQNWTGWLTGKVADPRKWDNEHPYLYTLTCRLKDGKKVLHETVRRVGFRQVEVRGNQMYINNMPVKLRGVCRHEVMPLRGRSVNDGMWRKDVELFRRGNVNYIRTSHYPPDEALLEACDELGIDSIATFYPRPCYIFDSRYLYGQKPGGSDRLHWPLFPTLSPFS